MSQIAHYYYDYYYYYYINTTTTTTTTTITTTTHNGLDIILTKILAWNPVVLSKFDGDVYC